MPAAALRKRGGREMEENTGAETGAFQPVNIPVQMFCAVDRTGMITPLQFRFELSGHRVELIKIERTLSRDEKNYVGIRERQYICSAVMEGARRLLELRLDVESQRWRIFQFLS